MCSTTITTTLAPGAALRRALVTRSPVSSGQWGAAGVCAPPRRPFAPATWKTSVFEWPDVGDPHGRSLEAGTAAVCCPLGARCPQAPSCLSAFTALSNTSLHTIKSNSTRREGSCVRSLGPWRCPERNGGGQQGPVPSRSCRRPSSASPPATCTSTSRGTRSQMLSKKSP